MPLFSLPSPSGIDADPAMREQNPLAAAPATERSERVGEEAEESRNGHVLLTPRSRVFSLPHEALFNQSAPMQHIKPVYTPLALRELVQGYAPKPPDAPGGLSNPVTTRKKFPARYRVIRRLIWQRKETRC